MDGVDVEQVWRDATANLKTYLTAHQLDNVTVGRSSEGLKHIAPFGKFRQVIAGPEINDRLTPILGA